MTRSQPEGVGEVAEGEQQLGIAAGDRCKQHCPGGAENHEQQHQRTHRADPRVQKEQQQH